MARVAKSTILNGISGRIGEVVVKQYSYGSVVSKRPDMSRVKASVRQKKEQNRFKEAVAYAQSIIRHKEKKAAYAKRLKKGQSVYHEAIKEFMRRRPVGA